MEHVSVLSKEVDHYMGLKGGEVVIDATLGLGGHSKNILKKIGKDGKLIAFEQDERNLEEAKSRLKEYEGQIEYVHENFRYLKQKVIGPVDAVFFDIGISSPHVDEADRGFSFMREGPLDMRFDTRQELTAWDVVNKYSEEELARVIYEYGEERASRKIAREICERREKKTFDTTTDLAKFCTRYELPQIFQGIRIEVNDEINALKEGLAAAYDLVKKDGRIVVISFHSLEDRLVKQYFNSLFRPPVEKGQEMFRNHGEPKIEKLTKKPITASDEELEENPRSRSAKLRAYKKI